MDQIFLKWEEFIVIWLYILATQMKTKYIQLEGKCVELKKKIWQNYI